MARGVSQRHFVGSATAASAADLDAFVARAMSGERFVYCSAPEPIRGEGWQHAGKLSADGLIVTSTERRQGGGWNYLAIRTAKKLKEQMAARTGSMDPALEAILRALKRAANFEKPCPTDSALAELAGLQTRDQAQWRIRKLVADGLIQSTVAYEGGVPFRVVTITATGKRTALPAKWAAFEAAAKNDKESG